MKTSQKNWGRGGRARALVPPTFGAHSKYHWSRRNIETVDIPRYATYNCIAMDTNIRDGGRVDMKIKEQTQATSNPPSSEVVAQSSKQETKNN